MRMVRERFFGPVLSVTPTRARARARARAT
jgi:hypothetical protein